LPNSCVGWAQRGQARNSLVMLFGEYWHEFPIRSAPGSIDRMVSLRLPLCLAQLSTFVVCDKQGLSLAIPFRRCRLESDLYIRCVCTLARSRVRSDTAKIGHYECYGYIARPLPGPRGDSHVLGRQLPLDYEIGTIAPQTRFSKEHDVQALSSERKSEKERYL
jgi:hypothetical protein